MSRRTAAQLRKAWIEWSNKAYPLIDGDPLLNEAHWLLEEYSYMVQLFHSTCICTFCGEEYWCRDVGGICPACGANVSQADMLNWSIFSADSSDEYAEYIRESYRRRGDLPLMPKGTPTELARMELRSFRQAIYELTAQDHENYDHILRHSLVKIKWLRRKIRALEGNPMREREPEELYSCDKCNWEGPLGEAHQDICGVRALWMCPQCIRKVLKVIDYAIKEQDARNYS